MPGSASPGKPTSQKPGVAAGCRKPCTQSSVDVCSPIRKAQCLHYANPLALANEDPPPARQDLSQHEE